MNTQSASWCFTLNNYTDDEVAKVRALQANANFIVYGFEIGESGTPHLQGFIQFKTRYRFSRVRTLLFERAHIEVARHPAEAAEYCRKDGNFEEFGVMSFAGKRNDLEKVKDLIKSGVTDMKRIREECPMVAAKYPRYIADYIEDNVPEAQLKLHQLRNWQQYLNVKLNRDANDREIIFVVDTVGNSGKSWFCRYYQNLHPTTTQCLVPARKIDMTYVLKSTNKVIFIDAPRSKQSEFIFYDLLEEIKNGFVFSTKYEPRIKRFAPPHLVVMMNEQPDMSKLSNDRYTIIDTSRTYVVNEPPELEVPMPELEIVDDVTVENEFEMVD